MGEVSGTPDPGAGPGTPGRNASPKTPYRGAGPDVATRRERAAWRPRWTRARRHSGPAGGAPRSGGASSEPPVLPSAPPPPPFCPHLTVGDGARPGDPGGVGGVGRALVPPRRPWDPRSAAPPFWARVSAREGGLVRLCPGGDVRVKRGLLFGKPLEK